MLQEDAFYNDKEEEDVNPYSQIRTYFPYVSPFDPCPPILQKIYYIPPNQFITFQPRNLPQFSPYEALKHGTIWPALYSNYQPNPL